MKLISWNVNGIRACVTKGFEDYFKETDADIFCIRESKLILGLSLILLGVAAAGKPVERLTAQQ